MSIVLPQIVENPLALFRQFEINAWDATEDQYERVSLFTAIPNQMLIPFARNKFINYGRLLSARLRLHSGRLIESALRSRLWCKGKIRCVIYEFISCE